MTRRFALTLALLLACAKAPVVRSAWDGRAARQGVVTEPPASSLARAADPELEYQMHERLVALARVGPHLVRGDVEQARAVATTLLEQLDTAESPERWRSHVAALRVEVRTLATADDLATAAAADARVAAECGACHAEVGVDPLLDDAPMPAHGDDERTAMQLHAWGVARLGEGLIGPSSDRWLQGTATFATLPGCEQPQPSRRELCSRAKRIAHRAHVAESTEMRVRLYGELLGTCAACHAG